MKSRRVLVVRIDSAYRLAASAATRGWMCFRCFGRGGVPYVRGSIDKWIVDLKSLTGRSSIFWNRQGCEPRTAFQIHGSRRYPFAAIDNRLVDLASSTETSSRRLEHP
jgi:hypothetical protein